MVREEMVRSTVKLLAVSWVLCAGCGSSAGVSADDARPAQRDAGGDQALVDALAPVPDAGVVDAVVDAPIEPEVVPAGEAWVVWESTRLDGNTSHVFLMKVDPEGEQASAPQQLTSEGGRAPMWSPDGRYISFMHPVTEATHVMRADGSDERQVFDGKPLFWIKGGSDDIACSKGNLDVYRVDPATGASELMFRRQDFAHFQKNVMQPGGITHDGRYMVVGTDLYRYGHKGDNGTFTASFAAAIVDLTDKEKVYFFGSGCAPRTPPAGDEVYHVCGDCPTKPDVYRMRLSDLDTRASYEPELAHADEDWGHSYMPRISNDNRWLVYGATTGCHDAWSCDYEIFIHRLRSGQTTRTRMTFSGANDRAPDLFVGTLPN